MSVPMTTPGGGKAMNVPPHLEETYTLICIGPNHVRWLPRSITGYHFNSKRRPTREKRDLWVGNKRLSEADAMECYSDLFDLIKLDLVHEYEDELQVVRFIVPGTIDERSPQ